MKFIIKQNFEIFKRLIENLARVHPITISNHKRMRTACSGLGLTLTSKFLRLFDVQLPVYAKLVFNPAKSFRESIIIRWHMGFPFFLQ